MAPGPGRSRSRSGAMLNTAHAMLFDPAYGQAMSWSLLAVETVLCLGVVAGVSYTEIDWRAYMDEVEGAINGTMDYTELKGDTGPLV